MISLEKRHEFLVQTLSELEDIIERNNLEYILLGGSVLGAIRHQNIIPWDDDIDIGLTREQFNKLEEILFEKKIEGYIFEKSDNHIIADAPIAKFRKVIENEKMDNYPTIDIFALDKAPDKKQQQDIQILCANFYNLINYRSLPKNRGTLAKVVSWIILIITRGKFQKKLSHFFYKQMTKWNYCETKYITNLFGYPNKKEMFKNQIIEEKIFVKFASLECPIPKDYDSYLTQMYDDYMEFPPINERIPKHV